MGGVTVVNDHKPNTFLGTNAVQMSSRQLCWQQFLTRFDFQWDYYGRDSDSNADVSGSVDMSGQLLQHIRDGLPIFQPV
ncbi:TPA: hypothetical protein ACH3X3_005142 [Trebouxia sp. C0006]